MGHSRFEVTDGEVRFRADRLDEMFQSARSRGYLEGYDPAKAETDPTHRVEGLRALASQFFDVAFDLNDDLVLNNLEFEWYDGAGFALGDMCELFAIAATGASSLTFLDFDDYTRDIYDIVFDGQGGYRREALIEDGVPVGRR